MRGIPNTGSRIDLSLLPQILDQSEPDFNAWLAQLILIPSPLASFLHYENSFSKSVYEKSSNCNCLNNKYSLASGWKENGIVSYCFSYYVIICDCDSGYVNIRQCERDSYFFVVFVSSLVGCHKICFEFKVIILFRYISNYSQRYWILFCTILVYFITSF